jgi:hypothetical protein
MVDSIIQIVADPGVSPTLVYDAQTGGTQAVVFLAKTIKIPYACPTIRIHLFASSERRSQSLMRILGVSKQEADDWLGIRYGSKGVIAIQHFPTQTIWARLDEPAFGSGSPGWSPGKIIAHEIFHLWQHQLLQEQWQEQLDPAWLQEGSAEYFAFSVGIAGNLFTDGQVTEYCNWAIGENGALLPRLEEMQRYDDFDRANNRLNGAVYCMLYNYFKKLHRDNPSGIKTYYQLRQQGIFWREAFEKSFGSEPKLDLS